MESMSWQTGFLPAETIQLSTRSQPMSWQKESMRTAIGKMSTSMVH